MEQADATSGHVVIDIGDEPSCCAVCMEPLEWVAIGRCGHGDVCAHCTAIIRFFHRNRRCCICRTRCPTVLVTKAGKDRPQAFSMPRPPSGCEGRVDGNYWYLRNMRAYFDDRRQYKKMRKVCVKPQLPASIAEGVTVDLGVPSQQEDVDAELDAVDALAAECGCVVRVVHDLSQYHCDDDPIVWAVLCGIREL
ncbi:hypothetical protein ACP70R_006525 [Stipagrostis hirtigluma subsp. patula]